MPKQRITYGEHAWEIEYQILSGNGQTGFHLLKVTGALTPVDVMEQFFKALKPLWNSLDLPANAALVMPEENKTQ